MGLVRRFPVPSVETLDLEPGEIDSVETSRVDVDLVRVGARNIERRDAAIGAEMMLRDAGVERIGREIFRRRQQLEVFPRHDPMKISLLRADRAVAFADAFRTALDFESDPPAVASAARNRACRAHRLCNLPLSTPGRLNRAK